MSFVPTSGLDWGSGVGPFPGTVTPVAAISILNARAGTPGFVLEEMPDSPEIERGEQATIRHSFKCDWETGKTLLAGIGRGTIFQDSYGNLTKCISSRLKRERGGVIHAVFEVISEGLSFDNPPDEFTIESFDDNPALEKHPRYADMTDKQRFLTRGAVDSSYSFDTQAQLQTYITGLVGSGAGGNEACDLLNKMRRGNDSFYLPGFRVTWSQYAFGPWLINPGGYIEAPSPAGGVPAFFWYTLANEMIFNRVATANPTLYANGISWLRLADSVVYSRTWFKITRSWLGSGFGYWDTDLYGKPPTALHTTIT